jgi:secreted PhoX family phosphatase
MNDTKQALGRRSVLGGAAAVGALATVAALTTSRQPQSPDLAAKTPVDTTKADGYRLTEHVKRYYATARI